MFNFFPQIGQIENDSNKSHQQPRFDDDNEQSNDESNGEANANNSKIAPANDSVNQSVCSIF